MVVQKMGKYFLIGSTGSSSNIAETNFNRGPLDQIGSYSQF
jgi:hypothetical protein